MNLDDLVAEFYSRGEFLDVPGKWLKSRLFDGFEDLCKETWSFQEVLGMLSVVEQYEYSLTPRTSNTEVCGIVAAERATVDTPIPSASVSETGGSLAAGTYYYRVTAVYDEQETLVSDAVSGTVTGSSGKITLSWSAISNAESYKIYGRTQGAEKLIGTTTSTSFDDDGSASPSGDYPVTSTLMEQITLSNRKEQSRQSRTWRQSKGDPATAVIWYGGQSIELDKIPEENHKGFQVRVALYPTANTVSLPAAAKPFSDAVKDYARWKLFEMPASARVTWSDPNRATYFMGLYQSAKNNLKARVFSGFGGSSQIKLRRFV